MPDHKDQPVSMTPTESVPQISLRQAGAGGALRCAGLAIEDAARHLDWHFQEMHLPREKYLERLAEINRLRIAADEGLKALWKLAGA